MKYEASFRGGEIPCKPGSPGSVPGGVSVIPDGRRQQGNWLEAVVLRGSRHSGGEARETLPQHTAQHAPRVSSNSLYIHFFPFDYQVLVHCMNIPWLIYLVLSWRVNCWGVDPVFPLNSAVGSAGWIQIIIRSVWQMLWPTELSHWPPWKFSLNKLFMFFIDWDVL